MMMVMVPQGHKKKLDIVMDIFYDPIKTMGDFFHYQTDYKNFTNAVTAQADFLSIDIKFEMPIALPIGTQDKMVCVINDDLVDASFLTFQIIIKEYQQKKEIK